MHKSDVLQSIFTTKIVAIIREQKPEVAYNAAMACIEGGLNCLEVALTTPRGLEVIERLSKVDGLVVGAGTVLDAETARAAIHSGAAFLLSPSVDTGMIRMCTKYGVVSIPGAFSPTEVVMSLEAGADIVKIFPASTLGPKHIESMAAPLPQARFLPSGGVSEENFRQWFVSGVVAVGVGGYLTATAADGNYASITAKAKRFVQAAEEVAAAEEFAAID